LVNRVTKINTRTPLTINDHVVHRFLSCFQRTLVDATPATSSSDAPLAGWINKAEVIVGNPEEWRGNPVIKYHNLVKAIGEGIDEETKNQLLDNKIVDTPEHVYGSMYELLSARTSSSVTSTVDTSSVTTIDTSSSTPSSSLTAIQRRKRTVDLVSPDSRDTDSSSSSSISTSSSLSARRSSVRVQNKETQMIVKQKDERIMDLESQLAHKQSSPTVLDIITHDDPDDITDVTNTRTLTHPSSNHLLVYL
jgi:hypothetical protein